MAMKNPFEGLKMIDISEPIYPGVLKADNTYYWGKHQRKFELKQFITGVDGGYMHFVEAEVHLGTHVECPAHFTNGAASPADMPLETFYGEAIVIKCKPGPMSPEDFKNVRDGDIVLLYGDDWGAWLSIEAARFLVDKKIKMLGVENVSADSPDCYVIGGNVPTVVHECLLTNNIPLIEQLANLASISKERVFFMGMPLRIHDIDSSWIRAVVWEEM
jgi:kynurenine formamidase